jgi:chromosome segregation ATPase
MPMMRFVSFLFAAAAMAQTTPPDSAALQALVNEIHQLRIDLQTTTVTTQRVQIVLYRLQSQTGLVTRAASNLEDARSSLSHVQAEKRQASTELQKMEERLGATQNPLEHKGLEENIGHIKSLVENFTAEEQRLQARVIDAETQTRAEQNRLADLQDQLDRLDKVLDGLTRK